MLSVGLSLRIVRIELSHTIVLLIHPRLKLDVIYRMHVSVLLVHPNLKLDVNYRMWAYLSSIEHLEFDVSYHIWACCLSSIPHWNVMSYRLMLHNGKWLDHTNYGFFEKWFRCQILQIKKITFGLHVIRDFCVWWKKGILACNNFLSPYPKATKASCHVAYELKMQYWCKCNITQPRLWILLLFLF